MKRAWPLGAVIFFLATSAVARAADVDQIERMSAEMKLSAAICTPILGQMEKYSECVTNKQRPIWLSYYPDTLVLFDDYRDGVTHTFFMHDQHALTTEAAQKILDIRLADFTAKLAQAARAKQLAAIPASPTESEPPTPTAAESLGDIVRTLSGLAATYAATRSMPGPVQVQQPPLHVHTVCRESFGATVCDSQ